MCTVMFDSKRNIVGDTCKGNVLMLLLIKEVCEQHSSVSDRTFIYICICMYNIPYIIYSTRFIATF